MNEDVERSEKWREREIEIEFQGEVTRVQGASWKHFGLVEIEGMSTIFHLPTGMCCVPGGLLTDRVTELLELATRLEPVMPDTSDLEEMEDASEEYVPVIEKWVDEVADGSD